MSLNLAASDHPDTTKQANSRPVDPEGTIIEWLKREAELERSFPYLKRKPSDTYPFRKRNYSLSTSSTTEGDHGPEEVEDLDPFEEDVYPAMAANVGGGGDAQSTASQDLSGGSKAFAQYPQFQQRVKNIVNQKRKSMVDPLEFSEFQLAWHTYKGKNEDTRLNKLLPFFMKEKRTLSIDSPAEEEDAHAVVSYLRSGLIEITNREFQRTCLPLREDGSPLEKKLLDAMAKVDGLTNPKPDRTFGVSMKKIPLPIGFSTPPEIAVWLETMRGVHHCFFLIEGKPYQGNLLDAHNEACRGGATLVGAARRLLATLGTPDIVGPDTRTFVFSATLSPGLMDIWIHWVDVPTPGALPLYHMNKIMSKAIDDEENFGQLRKALHNILDWGCGPRMADLQPLYPSIMEYAERQWKEAEQKTLAAKAAVQKAREEKAGNKRPRLASAG
ncbi:MAG: hypothetical protein Q9216_005575 [Gyalolechia sp. 2 TL-2023]